MREYCFSASHSRVSSGRTNTGTLSSRPQSSSTHHPLLQRKRTLDEFPMDHNRQDTTRLFEERRIRQASQRQHLASTTGESKQLSSYSRKRFETALTIRDQQSLPPPSQEEKSIFWEDVKPTWSYRRYLSMSATPVSKPVQLSPRPGSGPPGNATLATGTESGGRDVPHPGFNHLRGNNRAYPTIRKILQESNAEYRVMCPPLDSNCDRCRRPSVDCSTASELLLVPLDDEEDEEEDEEEERRKKRQEEGDGGLEKCEEGQLHAEMIRMSRLEDGESFGGEMRLGQDGNSPGDDKSERGLSPNSTRLQSVHKATTNTTTTTPTTNQDDTILGDAKRDEEDEDNPASPWFCWVDNATVSSIASEKKSEPETQSGEATPCPTPAVPEVVAEPQTPAVVAQESNDKGKLGVPVGKSSGKRSPGSVDRKKSGSSTDQKRKTSATGKGRKRGGKRTPEPVIEEIIGLPPPPPPSVVEEVVEEEVKEVEEPPEPVLPSYICPSSELKSTHTEIKLWLQKSSFSAANRLLPIY